VTTQKTDLISKASDLSSDASLVRALQSGEAAAYETMVRSYGPRMLATAKRLLRGEEDARDAVQEAFVQAFRNIGSFEGRSSLGTWLHRIAVNAALMKMRARRRKPEGSIDELLPAFDTDGCRIEPLWQLDESVESMVQRDQVRDLVRQSIDALPDDYRAIVILRDIEGHDTATVAEMLDISREAVKTRLHRARAALKKLLEPLYRGDGL
jgi:RNA polymerase sigma-70 factor (ECF subfamily)